MDSLVVFNKKLVQNNYKIRNQLLEYRVKEKFFESAFSFQSQQYIIVTIIIVLLGIVLVFFSFRFQTNELNNKFGQQIIDQKESFVGISNRIEKLEYNMDVSLGNISSLISEFHLKNGNLYQGFKYALFGARYLYQGTKLKMSNEKENRRWNQGVVALLNIALESLDKIELTPVYVESFKDQQNELFEQLNEVTKSDIDEIHSPASLIKIKLRKIVS